MKKKKEITSRLRNKINLKNNINKLLRSNKLSSNVKVHYIDHHISHIASAFYPSNYRQAIAFLLMALVIFPVYVYLFVREMK